MHLNHTICATLTCTIALVLAGPAWADREPVAVYGFNQTKGLPAGAADALTNALEGAIFRSGRYRVLSRRDLDRLRKEQEFQLSDECSGIACYAEIGGAAGAKLIVTGEVSRLGKRWNLVVRVVDMATTVTNKLGEGQCEGEVDCLLPEVKRAVEQLFGKPPPPIVDASADASDEGGASVVTADAKRLVVRARGRGTRGSSSMAKLNWAKRDAVKRAHDKALAALTAAPYSLDDNGARARLRGAREEFSIEGPGVVTLELTITW